ncbi:hypothetical protein GIB67_028214 [Kingdonia uniflora]|uniref:ornithine decarboxylase n=1 Tax=Kingdonia uniflora TaxID=39325 RepID=A0A7J7KZ58_9MAGN|nr:hypothetical protein GIB67_028214 [Kingdonia uniflora]
MSINSSDILLEMGSTQKGIEVILGSPWVKGKKVANMSKDGQFSHIQSIISNRDDVKEPFYILDYGKVVSLMDKWTTSLPNIKPYYAVKCNPDTALLAGIAALGGNFDCASKAEIQAILALGVSADRIIFANPCKAEAHIKYAAAVGVNLTTFDSVDEVEKMRKWHPKCNLLLRLKSPNTDENAKCPLGGKYGALPEEVMPLLQAAQRAEMAVTGISFHVGSAATHSRAYRSTIEAAKETFNMATRLGMPRMHILNIGGGFTSGTYFDDAAITIKSAIKTFFSDESNLKLMGEPGRYFAETPFTLAANIIGTRIRGDLREYWLNDGIYGSMNCILFDYANLTALPLACTSNRANPTCKGTNTYKSQVFGPTCDALDTIFTDYQLPELQRDDWLVFPNMGAYTTSAGSSFNGFSTSDIVTYLAYSTPIHEGINGTTPLNEGIIATAALNEALIATTVLNEGMNGTIALAPTNAVFAQ